MGFDEIGRPLVDMVLSSVEASQEVASEIESVATLVLPERVITLVSGRLPERTNGAASKAVVALRVTEGSNPSPSASSLEICSRGRLSGRPRLRLMAALRWFGSGTGFCSGYPIWEAVPGRLLCEYTTQEIITGISLLDPATVAGAVRLFVGHDFHERQAELGVLPDPMLQALKEEAEHSTDEDKKNRALRVFGEPT